MAKAKTPKALKEVEVSEQTQAPEAGTQTEVMDGGDPTGSTMIDPAKSHTADQQAQFEALMAEIKAKSQNLDAAIAEVTEQQQALAAVASTQVAPKHMEPRPPTPAAAITARTVDTLTTQHPLGSSWVHGDLNMPSDAPATVPGNRVVNMAGGYRVDF